MSELRFAGGAALPITPDTERLLTFEFDHAMYALPIAEVHEVAEADRICCVPTIPADQVGVMNWHGEALPVVAARLLFAADGDGDADADGDGSGGPDVGSEANEDEAIAAVNAVNGESGDAASAGSLLHAGHVLVVSARDDEPARLGLPIDRVLGLVDGTRRRRGGNRIIVERRPLDGRVVNVLDPCRLVARATEVIGQQTA